MPTKFKIRERTWGKDNDPLIELTSQCAGKKHVFVKDHITRWTHSGTFPTCARVFFTDGSNMVVLENADDITEALSAYKRSKRNA